MQKKREKEEKTGKKEKSFGAQIRATPTQRANTVPTHQSDMIKRNYETTLKRMCECGTSRTMCPHMAAYGRMWVHMAAHGHIWPHIA